MDVQLRHLRALVAVVDEGTFTDAGIALGVSQASVSRAIAALEEAIDAPVLRRTSREVSLTSVGARVLGHARRMLEDAAAITRLGSEVPGEVVVGYAWAALGPHTTTIQHRWAAAHPGSALRFVQSNTPSAGLAEGRVDLAVLRRPLDDDRFATVLVGVERRVAAMASDHPLARRRSLALNDFAGQTIAIDTRTGTTTPDLWPPDAGPAETRISHSLDDWITMLAAQQAIGVTSEATARLHPRPGIAYRPLRDAPPIPVWLAWWRDSQPAAALDLTHLACDVYDRSGTDGTDGAVS